MYAFLLVSVTTGKIEQANLYYKQVFHETLRVMKISKLTKHK